MKADGRWRIILFGNDQCDLTSPSSPLTTLCSYLEQHLLPQFTPVTANIDSIIDVRAVLQQSRQSFNMTDLPPLLIPHKGQLGLQDYEKVYTDEPSYGFGFGEIYQTRGVDRKQGCVVVVRPDQYISAVFPFTEEAQGLLRDFFGGILISIG